VDLIDPSAAARSWSITNLIGMAANSTWVYTDFRGDAYFDVLSGGNWSLDAATELPAIASLPTILEGGISQVTTPFLVTGEVTVKWTHAGTGNFIVDLIDTTDGSFVDSVANVIGTSSEGTVLYGHSGIFAFDVIADGDWTLEVTPN
jgi:hypothetical protein